MGEEDKLLIGSLLLWISMAAALVVMVFAIVILLLFTETVHDLKLNFS